MSGRAQTIILKSTDSSSVFPSNRPNYFINKLNGTIPTPGEWEMAITAIQYPYNWSNQPENEEIGFLITDPSKQAFTDEDRINKETGEALSEEELLKLASHPDDKVQLSGLDIAARMLKVKLGGLNLVYRRGTLPKGFYNSVQDMANQISLIYKGIFSGVSYAGELKFEYKSHLRKFVAKCTNPHIYIFNIEGRFLDVLGYHSVTLFNPHFNGIQVEGERESDGPPSLDPMKAIYVLSDCVDESYVGSRRMNILGVVPISGQHGDSTFYSFNPISYKPLVRDSLDQIDIRLCTSQGYKPFPIETGEVHVHLEIRPKF